MMTRRPRVFVVNQRRRKNGAPAVDLEPASRWGTVIPLLDGRVEHMEGAALIYHLSESLRDFGPNDYLLGLGDMAACLVAASIVGRKLDGRFNVLRWNDDDHAYHPVEVSL